jgi:hypothetical protein
MANSEMNVTDAIRRRYKRRPNQPNAAVRLALDTDGLVYRKWGAEQHAKAGDWIVDNDGEVHTVDADVFARTYRQIGIGAYVKTSPVWAAPARAAGRVDTKEGVTTYKAGDYLVSNNSDGSDAYAIEAAKFEKLYAADGEDVDCDEAQANE